VTLKEISQGYRDTAVLFRARLATLRRQLKQETDPELRWRLKREIAMLTPVLTQLNCLAELTEHYYEKEFYRDKQYCF
jgi:hypothetical protein